MTQVDVPPPVPAPPRGPGVIPPFPAPPTEGRRLRVGMGLGIGAGVLVLACGGGVAALVGLTTVMTNAMNEQAQVTIDNFLDDVQAKRYGEAYRSLCDSTRATVSEPQFTGQWQTSLPLRRWSIGTLDLADVTLAVPVDVTYTDGRTAQLEARMGQDRETGQLEVCSVEE